MKLDDLALKYLKGIEFSNGFTLEIDGSDNCIDLDRFSFLEDIVRNKKIIHLGCVDHLPLIQAKIQTNTWLHSRLCNSAERCLGIDINKEGIEYLSRDLGYSDVLCMDIVADENHLILDEKWDFLVMGEILEHVDNPLLFLKGIAEKYRNNIAKIIVSVPNAFSWKNIMNTFLKKECINSDHRYWFTPYTLAKIVTLADMEIEQIEFCNPISVKYTGLSHLFHIPGHLRNTLLKIYPGMKEMIVMVVII